MVVCDKLMHSTENNTSARDEYSKKYEVPGCLHNVREYHLYIWDFYHCSLSRFKMIQTDNQQSPHDILIPASAPRLLTKTLVTAKYLYIVSNTFKFCLIHYRKEGLECIRLGNNS